MRNRRARAAEIAAAAEAGRALPPRRRRAVSRPKLRRSHARIGLSIALLIALVAGVLVFDLVRGFNDAQGSSSTPVRFVVLPGDTASSIGTRLEHQGLVHDGLIFSGADLFSIDAKLQNLEPKLRVGSYMLRRNMSIGQMITALATESPICTRFTILPGVRAEQVAEVLRAAGFDASSFLRQVRHPGIAVPGLHVGWRRHHTLEGFLFPDTYCLSANSSGLQIVSALVDNFAHRFTPAMRRTARLEGRSIYKIVKMASIVQREDGIVSQMPLIASVYYNRLRLPRGAGGGVGELLQSDPTVAYALGPQNGVWWPAVSAQEAHSVRSPFNTYVHYGLPPGPIAEPDLDALRAALHPAKTNFYYFASCPGSLRLHFQTTLAEHNAFLNTC